MSNNELKYIPIHRVHRDDDTNTRTHYDELKAIELKDSVKLDGVIQNLIVTPREDGDFDLSAGFRRHRATELLLSELTELGTDEARALYDQRVMLPCMVVTRNQARLQMIENLQREKLDPMDEARGFKRALSLRDDAGELVYATHLALSEAIGKGTNPKYVSRRLKLLEAPDFLLDAIRAGTPVGIGEQIGAMPSIKDREEMARLALKHPELGIPMSDAQVRDMIRTRFCRPLAKCGFDLSMTDLLDEAEKKLHGHTGAPGEDNDGSCDRCLVRSGNAPDFSTGDSDTVSPWMCLNPRCFERKLAAQWQVMKGQIENAGNRYLTPATAAGLFEKGALVSEAYVAKDHRPGYQFTGHHAEETMPTWEEIFTGETVSWLVGQVPGRKGWCYLLEAAKALEIAEAKWKREHKPNLFANRPGKVEVRKPEVEAEAAGTGLEAEGLELEGQEEDPIAAGPSGGANVQAEAEPIITEEPVKAAQHRLWMGALNRALGEDAVALEDVVRALVTTRLPMLPLKALQLMATVLIDADEATILSWSRDAVMTMLVDGDAPSVDLMILAEAARLMIRDEAPEHELNELAKRYELHVQNVVWQETETAEGLAASSMLAEGSVAGLPAKEVLYDCEECGGKGFTKRGLTAHKCKRRQAKAAQANQPRVANPEAEERGWKAYLKTGSLKEAALKAGVPLGTVQNWSKRRSWTAKREAELAKK